MRVTLPVRNAALYVCLCAAVALNVRAQATSPPTLEQILMRMQAAEGAERDRPGYSVLREYQLSGTDASAPTSQVLAEVEYFPPSSKQFAIRKTEGSDRGEKIVRRVLEHEVRMTKDSGESAVIQSNYNFALLGQENLGGRRCYLLGLNPRRDTPELLKGHAWVDADSFLILRLEGEPAKSPSWWIKDLRVAIDYGRADGIWLPVTTHATADLRLLGTQVLTSRDVKVQASPENARLRQPAAEAPARKRPRNATVDAGVSMWR